MYADIDAITLTEDDINNPYVKLDVTMFSKYPMEHLKQLTQ